MGASVRYNQPQCGVFISLPVKAEEIELRKGLFAMVKVKGVKAGSPAYKAGLLPDDIIISVGGESVCDVLDYDFYMSDANPTLKVHRGAELFDVKLKKAEGQDAGLEFETYLMDEKRRCSNACIFCFIDQMPPGCRDSLYFKDDDDRLSFLQGNYITTTNLTEAQINRIIRLHLSPMNISVHATEPELRVFMMKNKRAGEVMGIMRRFADAGITLNAQIVLCRDVNDGEHLTRSMNDLLSLYPALNSVSIVPCGTTAYRKGLYPIEPFTKAGAREVIAQVESFSGACLEKYGTRLFFCSDEFYLTAGYPVKDEEYYEGCPQYENGVGMLASFSADFSRRLRSVKEDLTGISARVVTGEAAAGYISRQIKRLNKKTGLDCRVVPIKNEFFGGGVTVAGLVTGGDIIRQLANEPGGDLIIPSVMLRAGGDLFLDGTTPENIEEALGASVHVCSPDADGLIDALVALKYND